MKMCFLGGPNRTVGLFEQGDSTHPTSNVDFIHGDIFSYRRWHTLLLRHGTLATKQLVAPMFAVTGDAAITLFVYTRLIFLAFYTYT
jgi:hypothetical protein